MTDLSGKKVLIFVGNDYEDMELQYPKYRLLEAGIAVVVAGEEAGATYKGKYGYPQLADVTFESIDPTNFDGLIVPGGWMPDKLRRDPNVLSITKHFADEGKLLAAICHGGWVPISAGVMKDVGQTGSPGIKDDLINAGAKWEDAPVVVDRHFVSSRRPDDLPEFMKGVLEVLGG